MSLPWRAACLTVLVLATESVVAQGLIQNTAGRPHTDLGGEWAVIVDPFEAGYYDYRFEERADGYFLNAKPADPADLVEYDFATSPRLMVPGDWNSQRQDLFLYEGTVWYQRDFQLAKDESRHYVLHFGAANYEAIVYVNGIRVGEHEGGFTPFQFEISEQLRDGENFVVVKVDNRRERDHVPTVNTDWWNYGGLTRPVRLLELDRFFVADYAVQLDAGGDASVTGWIRAGGDRTAAPAAARLLIPELGIAADVQLDASGYGEFRIQADPERWFPWSPKLYDIVVVYGGDRVRDRIGFRTIQRRGEDLLLNGQPIYLRGISIHEEAPSREGRAWSEADARQTLGWARELNCNFVRLAHYPHNEAMLRMADEMGLLVWSEIPVYWTIQFENPAVYANAERQLVEMVARDRNRASIILWSVANETPDHEARNEFLGRLVEKARTLDPGRLVTAALDTHTNRDGVRVIDDPLARAVDVIGINSYCGWYGDTPENCAEYEWRSEHGKPVIVSEFGAGALHGNYGSSRARWTEEYQARVYEHNITMLENMPFVRGTTPWILRDFRSPRRPLPGIQDYWNRKGLLSEQGERKQAWYLLKHFYDGLSRRQVEEQDQP